ncbi:AAA family ATPase [Pseudonocardia kunmingensis]|uniref:MoxR-like ATPase n=1 Tax=Pseudonocardia kunmingensis TaxID=630975 RepID=A0A543CYD0_9PSEU|nr:AAA family ATPase [Pseudonocardia kunmingensis]TQM02079.1 MoxR-like ATPase [Pseudonocardia kunmingensis]
MASSSTERSAGGASIGAERSLGGANIGTGPDVAVVGLRREREVLTVALATGRHVVIEGPPGTGKSTLLRAIARDAGQSVVFVEGNAELTPARLVGQYDPAQVLAEGYLAASFVDGPLLTAMREGGLLYLEELNRVPEETLNVLITVLTEGEIAVPRLGTVHAGKDFRLIAAMNPFDAIGTARVSQAIADRMCRVVLGYQDEPAERAITSAVTALDGPVVTLAVALARATRGHRDVRMGSSVRGAIDLALVLTGLADLRGEPTPERETARDAAYAALSGRIRIADGVDRTPESVIDELLDELWTDDTDEAPPDGPGKAEGPPDSPAGFRPRSRPGRDRSGRTQGRAQLAAQHAAFDEVSPETGTLDAAAFDALLARDPEAAAALLADLAVATDEDLRAAARRLAGRVFLRLGRVGRSRARGTRRLAPARGGEGDLDLDRTLDGWQPGPTRRPTDLVTRSWTARRRAVALLVDVSGSMQGRAVALAAVAAAGVVLAEQGALVPAVLAFGAGVRVLQEQGVRRPPEELLSELVALRGHGTTDLAGGLRAASRQLAGAVADERLVVLLSDCLPTAGGEPAGALGGIDRLHVLVPLGGAEPEAAAAALAARGGGSAQTVHRLAEVGPALTRVLA